MKIVFYNKTLISGGIEKCIEILSKYIYNKYELEVVYVEDSILATIGKTISWIFYPMLGTNSWGATVSAIQGLVAKEQVISSMSVIAGLAEACVGMEP